MNTDNFNADYQHFVNLAFLYVLRKHSAPLKVGDLCRQVADIVGDNTDINRLVNELGLSDERVIYIRQFPDHQPLDALEIELGSLGLGLARQVIESLGGSIFKITLSLPPVITCSVVDARPTLFGCTLNMREAV